MKRVLRRLVAAVATVVAEEATAAIAAVVKVVIVAEAVAVVAAEGVTVAVMVDAGAAAAIVGVAVTPAVAGESAGASRETWPRAGADFKIFSAGAQFAPRRISFIPRRSLRFPLLHPAATAPLERLRAPAVRSESTCHISRSSPRNRSYLKEIRSSSQCDPSKNQRPQQFPSDFPSRARFALRQL